MKLTVLRTLLPSPLFVSVCIGLGAVTWFKASFLPAFQGFPDPTSQTIATASKVTHKTIEYTQLLPLLEEQRKALFDRPLFVPSRQPSSKPVLEPPPKPIATKREEPPTSLPVPPPPSRPTHKILGVIRAGQDARVLLAKSGEDVERWYRVGDTVDGWTVAEIQADKIRLSQSGTDFILKLER